MINRRHTDQETVDDIVLAARRRERQARVAALRDGRRQRSNRFRPRKGRGSYRRRGKHSKFPL